MTVRPRRERPKAVKLSGSAAARLREIMAGRPDDAIIGLRVGVKNGGCAGMEYTMDYARDVKPTEEVVEDQGLKIVVDPKAILFLFGTTIDFETTKLKSGFTFRNPNQTDACGCGESVAITPVDKASLETA